MFKNIVIVITVVILLVLMVFWSTSKSREAKLIEEVKSELFKIIDSNDIETVKINRLKNLAKKVGAGTEHTENEFPIPVGKGYSIRPNPISESELVQNIQQALQTLTMIDMCNVATKNYRIAMLSMAVAVISALVAWAEVKKKQKPDLDKECRTKQ
jgi:hypothetical protein